MYKVKSDRVLQFLKVVLIYFGRKRFFEFSRKDKNEGSTLFLLLDISRLSVACITTANPIPKDNFRPKRSLEDNQRKS